MRQFRCICGASLFFDNHYCLSCGREVGFDQDRCELVALDGPIQHPPVPNHRSPELLQEALPSDPPLPSSAPEPPIHSAARHFSRCENRARSGCPWLVPAENATKLCVACRLNRAIPNLSVPEDHEAWHRVEAAKRRWVYGLLRLGLPVISKLDDPERGIALDVMRPTEKKPVMTGHAGGVITLNLNEADPVEREVARQQMQERYRTLLGHLRHESGHFYWDYLIDSGDLGKEWLERFRELFGDERDDYAEALKRHYAESSPKDFRHQYVSHYASSHPWEDFAESWAHYLHLFDGLETARSLNLLKVPSLDDDESAVGFEEDVFEVLMESWIELTLAMNSLNRSLGLRDPYPFVLTPVVKEKMRFIHELILAAHPSSGAIAQSQSTN